MIANLFNKYVFVVLTDDFLLIADASGIRQMSLDGTSLNLIKFSQDVNAVAMDYDPLLDIIFWTDIVNDSINQMPIQGGPIKLLVQLDYGNPF